MKTATMKNKLWGRPLFSVFFVALGLILFYQQLGAQVDSTKSVGSKLVITKNWSNSKAYSLWTEVRASWSQNADSIILVQKKKSARLVGSFGDSINMVTVKRQIARKDAKGNVYYDFINVDVDANKFSINFRPALRMIGLKYLPKETKIQSMADVDGNKRWVFLIPGADGILMISKLRKEAGSRSVWISYNTLELQKPITGKSNIRPMAGGGLVFEDDGQIQIIRADGSLRSYVDKSQNLTLKDEGNGMQAIIGIDEQPLYWLSGNVKTGLKEFGFCVGRLDTICQGVINELPTANPDSIFVYATNESVTLASLSGVFKQYDLSKCLDAHLIDNPKELKIGLDNVLGEPILKVKHERAGGATIFIRRGTYISDTDGEIISKTTKNKFLIFNHQRGAVYSLEDNGSQKAIYVSDANQRLLEAKHFVLDPGRNDILEIKVEINRDGKDVDLNGWYWFGKYGREDKLSDPYGYSQAFRVIRVEDRFSSDAEYEHYVENQDNQVDASGREIESRHVYAFTAFPHCGIELVVANDLTPDHPQTFQVFGRGANYFSSMTGKIDSVKTVEDFKPEQYLKGADGQVATLGEKNRLQEVLMPQAIFMVYYTLYYWDNKYPGEQWAWYPHAWTTKPLGHFIAYTPKFDTYIFVDWQYLTMVKDGIVSNYPVIGLKRQVNSLLDIQSKVIEYWDDDGNRCLSIKLYDASSREMQISNSNNDADGMIIVIPDDKRVTK